MPTHDDLLLEGHDEGFDGEGCCPSCTARLENCNCCPICEGNGRVRSLGIFKICPACDGEGYIEPKAEVIEADQETPL